MARKIKTPIFIIPPSADIDPSVDVLWKAEITDGTSTWRVTSVVDVTTKHIINTLVTWSMKIFAATAVNRTNFANGQNISIWRDGTALVTDGEIRKIKYDLNGDITISGPGNLFKLRKKTTGQAWQFNGIAFNTLVGHLNDADDDSTNLASGATMTASSEESGWDADEAVDDTTETDGNGWKATSTAVPAWVKADFGSNQSIKRLRIWRYIDGATNAMPLKFKVEYSTDDSTYSDVNAARTWYRSSADAKYYDVKIPETVTARYIRITIISMTATVRAGIGEIEAFEPEDIVTESSIANLGTASFRFDGETRLKAIASATMEMNGEFMENGDGELVIADELGRGSSDVVKGFKEGRNIELLDHERDAWNVVNRVDQRGVGEGSDQLTLHAESTTNQAQFGVCEYMHVDQRVERDDSMATQSATLLSTNEDEVESMRLVVHYWETTVALGDYIHIISARANVDGNYRVIGIIRHANSTSGETMEYLISNKRDALSDKLAPTLNLDADTLNAHPKGSASFNSYQDTDNCGTGFPLNLKVRVPTTAIVTTGQAAVNRVLLSYYVTDYRAFSETSGTVSNFSGLQNPAISSGTETITDAWLDIRSAVRGTEDILDEVFVLSVRSPNATGGVVRIRVLNSTDTEYYPNSSGIPLTLEAEGEQSSVTIHTGKNNKGDTLKLQAKWDIDPSADSDISYAYYELGEHKHVVGFAINEDTGTPTAVTVTIDGTDRTTALGISGAGDQVDIDITEYVTTTGNHTIAIEPNKNCRIYGQSNVWLWARSG